ncbi:DUF6150 family protein [Flavobacterium psychrophilum]|uniref:7(1) septoil knot domain-containing protein n=1 Tax=Flavobacterium psychrophilum TaxID=96345 RepID=A0A7U2RAK4_FLAPS|nr:DUF6150 family protein [Flavobacterium psychrophilum]QRE04399.1 hypothetical protein H0H26_01995 [Flavobacterium psychrophilum]
MKLSKMKLNQIFIILFVLFGINSYSQKVYYTTNPKEANYKIFISQNEYEANWIVLKTSWNKNVKKGIWFEVKYKNEADIIVFVVAEKYLADKVVFFTEYESKIKY